MTTRPNPMRYGVRVAVILFVAFGNPASIIKVTIPCKRRLAVADDLPDWQEHAWSRSPAEVVARLCEQLAGAKPVRFDSDTPLRWATDEEIETYLEENGDA